VVAVAALFSDSSVLGDPRTLLEPSRRSRVLSLIATDRYARTFQGRGAAALEVHDAMTTCEPAGKCAALRARCVRAEEWR